MKVLEIAFSCYPVTDMARARTFYEGVLGLKPTMQAGEPGGMEWTEYDIANGTLSIGAGAPNWTPTSSGCSVGLEVDDFDASIAHLRAHDIRFHMEPFDTPRLPHGLHPRSRRQRPLHPQKKTRPQLTPRPRSCA